MAAVTLSDAVEPIDVEPTVEPAADVALTPGIARELRALNAPERRDDGEIVSIETAYRRLRVLGCSAPNAANAKVTTTLAASATAEGGFSVKLAGFGVENGVKYTVTQDLKLERASGKTKIGYLLVPLSLETRLDG